MDECIDGLNKATVFSTLDAKSGYWQIKIEYSQKDKTSFTSHSRLHQLIGMNFGPYNAPRTFQRTMDFILFSVKRQFVLKYLDDIVVPYKTPEQPIEHVRKVLSLLNSAGAAFKLSKCNFFTYIIAYLYLVIHPRQLEPVFHITDAILGLKPPPVLPR